MKHASVDAQRDVSRSNSDEKLLSNHSRAKLYSERLRSEGAVGSISRRLKLIPRAQKGRSLTATVQPQSVSCGRGCGAPAPTERSYSAEQTSDRLLGFKTPRTCRAFPSREKDSTEGISFSRVQVNQTLTKQPKGIRCWVLTDLDELRTSSDQYDED